MKFTAVIVQMIRLALNSYMILAIRNQQKLVRFVVRSLLILVVLKIKILKNTVSTIMIQSFVRPLEISVMQMVL